MDDFLEHAKESGSEVLNDKVSQIKKEDGIYKIKTLG
jgi:thioredoxin reductase